MNLVLLSNWFSLRTSEPTSSISKIQSKHWKYFFHIISKSKWAYAQTAALEGCLTLAPGSEAAVWDNWSAKIWRNGIRFLAEHGSIVIDQSRSREFYFCLVPAAYPLQFIFSAWRAPLGNVARSNEVTVWYLLRRRVSIMSPKMCEPL